MTNFIKNFLLKFMWRDYKPGKMMANFNCIEMNELSTQLSSSSRFMWKVYYPVILIFVFYNISLFIGQIIDFSRLPIIVGLVLVFIGMPIYYFNYISQNYSFRWKPLPEMDLKTKLRIYFKGWKKEEIEEQKLKLANKFLYENQNLQPHEIDLDDLTKFRLSGAGYNYEGDYRGSYGKFLQDHYCYNFRQYMFENGVNTSKDIQVITNQECQDYLKIIQGKFKKDYIPLEKKIEEKEKYLLEEGKYKIKIVEKIKLFGEFTKELFSNQSDYDKYGEKVNREFVEKIFFTSQA